MPGNISLNRFCTRNMIDRSNIQNIYQRERYRHQLIRMDPQSLIISASWFAFARHIKEV